MGHTEDFIHARSDGVDGSGATDFVFEFWAEFLASCDDLFAFFAVGIPGIFGFGAGFLAEGRECDLGETILDDFVARSELVFFPITELSGGLFDSGGDFGDLFVGEGVIIYLFPIFLFSIIAIILCALCDKQM